MYGLRQEHPDARPWEEHLEPVQHDTATVSLVKPGGTDEGPAEETTTVRKHIRKRTRALDDGGVATEEQDIVFREKIVVWAPPMPAIVGVKNEVRPNAGTGTAGDDTACVD